MKINHIYTQKELTESGFVPGKGLKTDTAVYKKQNKIYLFEKIKQDELRLHSIITEASYYL